MAQTRLEARTHRPDVEMCRDPVYHRLVEEVGQIQESVDLLHRKLGEAESAHQASALRLCYPICYRLALTEIKSMNDLSVVRRTSW